MRRTIEGVRIGLLALAGLVVLVALVPISFALELAVAMRHRRHRTHYPGCLRCIQREARP